MKRLIVNADDFGLHEAVNRGIYKSHAEGIVTSTSLMAGGAAFDDAVAIKQRCPKLDVGIHLTLVGGRPVAPVQRIASLVDEQGQFCSSYPVFLARYLRGIIRLADVEQELMAQIEKMKQAGLNPTHLDSHQHLHVVPGISDLVLSLARRFSIRAIRIPAEPFFFFGGIFPSMGRVAGRDGLTALAEIFRHRAVAAGFLVTGHFFGMLAGGQMKESALSKILESLPDGVSEIMVHPGEKDETLAAKYSWGYHWDDELQALCSAGVKQTIREQKIQLISFQEL
jgi:hopanoid biosynthesis associated protein HpnK